MCEFTKPGSSAGQQRHAKLGEPSCPECNAARNDYQRGYQTAERQRWQHVYKYYRLRQHEYEALLAAQDGVCAICQTVMTRPHIDHRHDCDHTDKGSACCSACVRGIICASCNRSLFALDDREWLKKALDYVDNVITVEMLRQSRLW